MLLPSLDIIKRERERLRLSQKQLANMANVSTSMINQIESGRCKPSYNTAKTIFENHPKIHKIDAPIIQISATLIRQGIKNNKNVEPMLPKEVWKYIDEMNFYRT